MWLEIEVGEALVKLQGRIAKLFQITVPEFMIEKGKITDAHIKQHMLNIAPALPEEDFRIASDTTMASTQKPKTSSKDTLMPAFLKDIQQYPGSGIAARYKQLNISVRQGQKLKAKAIDKGLIEEYLETTKAGRLKVIQLTEKGKAFLA